MIKENDICLRGRVIQAVSQVELSRLIDMLEIIPLFDFAGLVPA